MRSDGLANRICTKATAWNRYRSEWAEGTSQIYFFSRPAPKLRERRWRRQLYAIRDRLGGNPLKPDTAALIGMLAITEFVAPSITVMPQFGEFWLQPAV